MYGLAVGGNLKKTMFEGLKDREKKKLKRKRK